jgi:hypothetical protein
MTLASADGESMPPQQADRGGPASRVCARAGEDPRELLARVGLSTDVARPVIVVCGGADDLRGQQLSAARAVLGPAVRAATSQTGAAIVDGGTAFGVMSLLGEERARHPATMPVLVGVAPAGRVDVAGDDDDERHLLDPHHTHFVLADSDEWGGETPVLAAVAAELAHGASVVMVLAGGGKGALKEVHIALKRAWPLFVLEGTGGIADEIAAACHNRGDPQLRLQIERGDVRKVGCDDPFALGRSLAWELQDDPALKDAWVLFATYDRLAIRLRETFERFQASILVLGIVATAIALVHDVARQDALRNVLHWAAVAAPIVVSVLIALANRRAAGKRWVLLRAAAEAVKSEIYRYRTRTGVYSDAALASGGEPIGRPQRLAERLGAIDSGLIHTDASGGPLTGYLGPLPPAAYGTESRDDGLSSLDPARYVEIRVADQLGYYRGKVRKLDRRRAALQLVTLAAGGLGALLAAAGAEIWIGLTTALSGAALAHLGYLQVDNTIVAFNQAATQLAALEREFRAANGATPDFETLVTRAETVLTTELSGWVQQMTDALAELQDQQSEAAAKVEQQRDEAARA